MSSPTPAISWISASISPSMRLTPAASWSNGSPLPRVGSRSRRSPATMRWMRRLTSESRSSARTLSTMPITSASANAGSRPSASARPTISAISSSSLLLRPIASVSPSGSGCTTSRTFWVSRASPVEPDHHRIGGHIGRDAVRQALQIAGDASAVGGEQAGDADVAGIVAQPELDPLPLPRRPIGGDQRHVAGEQAVERRRHVGCGLQVDEAEQQQRAQHERAGDAERPAERGGADEFRQAHGG